MDNHSDIALGSAFDTAIFILAAISMVTIFGFSYRYLYAKIHATQNGPALNVQEDYIEGEGVFEDQNQIVYLGQKERSGGLGSLDSSGESLAPEMKVVDDQEYSTGASVFTEIQALSATITEVRIGSVRLVNRPDKPDNTTVNSINNIAYYVKRGQTDQLMTLTNINTVSVYQREYKTDEYGVISSVVYTRIS